MSASKRKSFFVLAALCLASLCLAKDISITCVPASEGENYAIEFDWHGMDAQKIERLVAVPLEEKLRALENVVSVLSVCENSKCKTDVSFEKKIRPRSKAIFPARGPCPKLFCSRPFWEILSLGFCAPWPLFSCFGFRRNFASLPKRIHLRSPGQLNPFFYSPILLAPKKRFSCQR